MNKHNDQSRSSGDSRARSYDHARAIDVHEDMHSLFVLALLAAHPDPEAVRGQFRALLKGLAASHSRYVFGDDFVVSVRRSILRFDHMLRLVQVARGENEATVENEAAKTESVVENVDAGELASPDGGGDVAPQPEDVELQQEPAAIQNENEPEQRVP